MSDRGRIEKKIGLVSDEYGLSLKERILDFLAEGQQSVSVRDFGTFSSKESDREKLVASVARAVSSGNVEHIILVGATAAGMSMFVNKFAGARSVVVQSAFEAEFARRQYDANVLCFGECTPAVDRILSVWLKTPFEGRHGNRLSHHACRLAKIAALENTLSQSGEELSHQKTASEESQPVTLAVAS